MKDCSPLLKNFWACAGTLCRSSAIEIELSRERLALGRSGRWIVKVWFVVVMETVSW